MNVLGCSVQLYCFILFCDKTMRILHVITSLHIGGAERLMVDLLPILRDAGNNVELLLFDGLDTPFKKELKQKGIVVHQLFPGGDVKYIKFRVYNPINILRLRQYLGGYDIIHTHNTACQLFVPLSKWLFRKKTVLVTTEHNATNRRRDKSWLKSIDCWMYRQYSRIICIADQTNENLQEYIGAQSKILTIYNGVNISQFVKPINDICGKTNYVLSMVAAFRLQKDHETLLRAMSRLPMNYRLQLVGRDFLDRVPSLKAMCKSLGIEDRVDFMGGRTDIPDILAGSDVVVLSSHWEGLSLSSIEGMASGRPFVASDVDGLHEMVGGAGVLFPHGDDKALAEKIQYLCEHPDEYRAVAERCQEKAKQYDISVMAEKYLELYKKVYEENQKDN